mmetsp:Transcript_1207/g.1933  ORF Transcript_1207/g.1933 Transcript_1207/m.1933 type:complete len:200 (-) Transcript_1207:520-1119(-)
MACTQILWGPSTMHLTTLCHGMTRSAFSERTWRLGACSGPRMCCWRSMAKIGCSTRRWQSRALLVLLSAWQPWGGSLWPRSSSQTTFSLHLTKWSMRPQSTASGAAASSTAEGWSSGPPVGLWVMGASITHRASKRTLHTSPVWWCACHRLLRRPKVFCWRALSQRTLASSLNPRPCTAFPKRSSTRTTTPCPWARPEW